MNVPNVVVKPSVLRPETVSVSDEGELVVMKIGNAELRMHYSDALTFSQWIRMRAKAAKRRAGDVSRHWSAVAELSDLSKLQK